MTKGGEGHPIENPTSEKPDGFCDCGNPWAHICADDPYWF
jgi:hypothetical protein